MTLTVKISECWLQSVKFVGLLQRTKDNEWQVAIKTVNLSLTHLMMNVSALLLSSAYFWLCIMFMSYDGF